MNNNQAWNEIENTLDQALEYVESLEKLMELLKEQLSRLTVSSNNESE